MAGLFTVIKREINLFWLALAFFTRIPVPAELDFSSEKMNHASRWYAAIGALIGFLLAAFLYPLWFFLPENIAAIILTGASLLLTGAFHEDGFADMCDGFGGGFDPEKKIVIMKDSRLGTFGGAGLFMELTLEWALLAYVLERGWLSAAALLISLHALSRGISGALIFFMPYQAALDLKSKSKPLATGMRKSDLLILVITALIPGWLLLDPVLMTALCVTGGVMMLWFRSFLMRHIGGFTGDCLGALQILALITGLIIAAVFLKGDLPVLSAIMEINPIS